MFIWESVIVTWSMKPKGENVMVPIRQTAKNSFPRQPVANQEKNVATTPTRTPTMPTHVSYVTVMPVDVASRLTQPQKANVRKAIRKSCIVRRPFIGHLPVLNM